MISFKELVQTKIDSFEIYTLNFQSDTRYGSGINDIIQYDELTTLMPLQLKGNDSVITYINSLDLSPYSGGINLRLLGN